MPFLPPRLTSLALAVALVPGLAACGSDLRHGGVGARHIHIGHDYASALLRETQRNSRPQPATGARYKCELAFQ